MYRIDIEFSRKHITDPLFPGIEERVDFEFAPGYTYEPESLSEWAEENDVLFEFDIAIDGLRVTQVWTFPTEELANYFYLKFNDDVDEKLKEIFESTQEKLDITSHMKKPVLVE